MRIGFDVAQTCVDRAGCGWYADSLVRALVKLAPEHQFNLYHHFGGWINTSIEKGTMIDAPNVESPLAKHTFADASRLWGNPAEFAEEVPPPDIVHANCYQAPTVPGAKLIYTVYDVSFWAVPEFTTEANRLLCQSGTLAALNRADGFVFISQSAHDEFERIVPGWLERNARPWVVTPLGPRMDAPATPKITDGQYWLAVGSIEPRKNYEVLLDALELYWSASTRRLPLRIAGGRGWQSAHLHSRFTQLANQGMLEYLGYVPDNSLPGLYSDAEALVFPSWYEGFGLPVLEAMSFGCPVISSNRTSLPEVGGETVAYIDPADPQQIARAMLELERDPAFRERMIRGGLAQAASFSWENTARLTLNFYQRVMASNDTERRPANAASIGV
jgi:glycosyltransferase involved in cell wall biosynthesis